MDHHTVQSEPSYGPYPLNFHSGRQPQLRVQPQSSLSPIDRVMPGENVNFSFPSSSGPAGENICDYHPMAASFTPLYPPTFESMVPLSMPGPYESLHPSPMEYRSERSFDALIPFLATPATLPSPLYAQNAEDMAFLRGIGAHPINEPSSSSRRPSLEGSILLQPLNHLPSV
ncbi:hypothetical protein D9757_012440 [Collybiopsis confluens]|uniref:Uncharacterized protein n=1 Tax=Collybiopsis confluens TaxID=2823264 RepID=A0A8H5CGG8_9AGAR|nr:hypothetical protein D9757_014630 [Collybiopsis confluens]KAF5349469.1 hypothetical protein D9757_012440 [Collybiopsis confluens]